MDVNKADAHNVDEDIIEVIVAVDLNPDKKSKPINGKGFEKPYKMGEEDEDEEGKEDGEDEEGDEPDWKALCKQLLQAITDMDSQTDAAMEGGMSDEEAIKAIDQITSRVLWGKQEENNPFSSYQNMNYGKSVAAGMIMDKEADLEGMGYAPGKAKPEEEDDRPKKKSKGFKAASKQMLGLEDEEPEDDEEESDDDMEEDDSNGKKLFSKSGKEPDEEEDRKGRKEKGFRFPGR